MSSWLYLISAMWIWTETDLDSIIFCFKLPQLFTAQVQSRSISAWLFFFCAYYLVFMSTQAALTIFWPFVFSLSVMQCQKPGPYVKEMNDAAMFYTNRVLKDYKDTLVDCFCVYLDQFDVLIRNDPYKVVLCFDIYKKWFICSLKKCNWKFLVSAERSDGRHVEWVRSYLSIWTELQSYIKDHHTTGLIWSKTVSETIA